MDDNPTRFPTSGGLNTDSIGKLDDHCIVYSDVDKMEAYNAFIASEGELKALDRFGAMCMGLNIRLAARARVEERPEFVVDVEQKVFHGNSSVASIRAWVSETIVARGFSMRRGNVRTLSKINIARSKKAHDVYDPDSAVIITPGTEPGDWSAFVFDTFKDGHKKKSWRGIVVKVAFRTDKLNVRRHAIRPTDDSLHPTFRRSA